MVLVVGHVKGGCGKSTLATNLAVMAATAGKDVLLLDADPQGTSTKFTALREGIGHTPGYTCTAAYGEALRSVVQRLKSKFDVIIVDVGGRDTKGIRHALLEADKLLTPTLPGQFDCWELEETGRIASEAQVINEKLQCYLVINCADTNPRVKMTQETAQFAAELPVFSLLDTRVGFRVTYRRAASEGLGVCEMTGKQRDNNAVTEMTAVYEEMFHGYAQNP